MNENPYSIGPRPFDLTYTFEATVTGDVQQLADLFPPEPPKHDVRLDYADGAGRWCPVCEEPVTALVVEVVEFLPSAAVHAVNGGGQWQLHGINPAAYRAEPCGHRFGHDGKEIERG